MAPRTVARRPEVPRAADLLTGAAASDPRRLAALLDDVWRRPSRDPGEPPTPPVDAAARSARPRAVGPGRVGPNCAPDSRPAARPAGHRHEPARATSSSQALFLQGHGSGPQWPRSMIMRPDSDGRAARRRPLRRHPRRVTVATGIWSSSPSPAGTCPGPSPWSAPGHVALLRAGYAVGQLFVSAYVVFLLGIDGVRWDQTVPEDRVTLTLIGGRLAMIGCALPRHRRPRGCGPGSPTRLAAAEAVRAAVWSGTATRPGPARRCARGPLRPATPGSAWQEALDRAGPGSRYAAAAVPGGRGRGGGHPRHARPVLHLLEAQPPGRERRAPGAPRRALAEALHSERHRGGREAVSGAAAPAGSEGVPGVLADRGAEPERTVLRGPPLGPGALDKVSESPSPRVGTCL